MDTIDITCIVVSVVHVVMIGYMTYSTKEVNDKIKEHIDKLNDQIDKND